MPRQCTIEVINAERRRCSLKFIHIADVHLGVKPDQGKPWSEQRARQIWDSFADVIGVAKREKPEFLFVTGDLFHAQPLKKEVREVSRLFGEIPDTQVLLIAGNHDYLREKSYYLADLWPDNVTVFKKEEAEAVDFPEYNTTVYGLSYWHREIRDRRYDDLRPVNRSRRNILLAHGGDERHIPFSAERILQNGFDYIAAGHIHRSGWLMPHKAVMAGSLEPTDCNDTGPHGYWMGTLGAAGADVYFYPLRHCEYCHEMYQADRNTTDRMLWDWAKELLEQRPEYQYFRLYIKGKKDPEYCFDVQEIGKLDRIVDITDQTVPDYDYGKLLEEHADSILGEYIRSMRKKEPGVCTAKALEYGVNALLGYDC